MDLFAVDLSRYQRKETGSIMHLEDFPMSGQQASTPRAPAPLRYDLSGASRHSTRRAIPSVQKRSGK
ncbi:MAG: hypothetical protein CBARDCOR_5618 [uncultured Caballeronia sp.]|nr:MAG: hypothetical protein CBARDCOR_5618 [uncultured Caballeronia sp.]